jgi:hypothetical protein
MTTLKSVPLAFLLAGCTIAPAFAQDLPDYMDDRSTAESVLESFYNAIDRQEYARAWSYYKDGEGVPKFDDFVNGYSSTKSVDLTVGETSDEGAAGSTFYTVPVSLVAVDSSGKHSYFAGCYTLRLADPQIQAAPPFDPLHIVEGHLKKAKGAGDADLPDDCGQ